MDKGDLATWVGAGVAFCFSLAALIVSIKALRWQREGAEIAKRAQEFVEQRFAAEEAKAEEEARQVRWELERTGKNMLVLRNVSQNRATGVTIDGEQFKGFGRELPNGVEVPPSGSVRFMVGTAMGAPMPNEVWITWDDVDQPIALPIPPW